MGQIANQMAFELFFKIKEKIKERKEREKWYKRTLKFGFQGIVANIF